MEKTISVIVPAFNCEDTISRCLDSILNQTIADELEIIVVNDGSTDSTGELLAGYEENNSDRIKVLNQKNSGPGCARNRGLAEAQGEYIGFVDADDFIEPNMFEIMKAEMSGETDLAVCGRYNIHPSGHVEVRRNLKKFNGESLDTDPQLLSRLTTFVWDKLFKKQLILTNEITFPTEFHYAEDFYFLQRYVMVAGKVAVIDEPLCHHFLNGPDSITGTCNKTWLEICDVLSCINELCIREGTFDKYKRELLYSSAAFYCRRIRSFRDTDKVIIPILFVAKFMGYFNKYFKDDWKDTVSKHRIKDARKSRTSFVRMVKYILRPKLKKEKK